MASRRFKRALLGFNRDEVTHALEAHAEELREQAVRAGRAEAALEEVRGELDYARAGLLECRRESDVRGNRVRELEAVVTWLADRVVDRERELRAVSRTLESELEARRAERADAEDGERAPLVPRSETERPAQVAAAARGSEAGEPSGAPPPPDRSLTISSPPGEAAAREAVSDATAAMAANGSERSELFEGAVELEVGPLRDFSQLAGFEDAAGGIQAASEITVKRFSKGRATIRLELDEPVELLTELEQRAPFEFRVRDTRAGRVVLDVDR